MRKNYLQEGEEIQLLYKIISKSALTVQSYLENNL